MFTEPTSMRPLPELIGSVKVVWTLGPLLKVPNYGMVLREWPNAPTEWYGVICLGDTVSTLEVPHAMLAL